jgi:catechol 2,3-dioxygenase-like lactoylglutathione lyase family enzyme
VMHGKVDHHVALRVSDMDAAIAFWQHVIGAEVATAPAVRSGGYFDQMFTPGVQVKVCHLFCEAGALELFEFVVPRRPVPPSDQTGDGMIHFGIRVDDVPATLARVEEAGGRAILPPAHMQNRPENPRFVYCTTPDGHVFELLEADHPRIVELIIDAVPEAKPAGS